MKTLNTLTVIMLILSVTFLLTQPVEARDSGGGSGGHSGVHGGHGGDHHGDHHHRHGHGFFGGFGYGWWGYPYWWDYPYWWWDYPYYPYYYPYYDPYYYEGHGEPPVPPQGLTPPAESEQQQPSFWHFCQDPEGYYPYVKDCRVGWLTVVPSQPNAPPPATLGVPILPPSPPGKKSEKQESRSR